MNLFSKDHIHCWHTEQQHCMKGGASKSYEKCCICDEIKEHFFNPNVGVVM